MFDRDPVEVRRALSKLLGGPADLDAELERVGPELLDLAARNPGAFKSAISAGDEAALSTARRLSVDQLRAAASRTLAARVGTPR
jgi:hypothetical protein